MRHIHFTALASLVALGASSIACGGSSSGPANGNSDVQSSSLSRNMSPNAPAADIATLASDNDAFAFDMYHAVEAKAPGANLFYSPYSVSIALAMTYAGANGPTANDIASTMKWTNLPGDRLHSAFNAIDLSLAALATSAGAKNGGFTLNVADSLWGDRTETFVGSYLDTLAVNYGSELRIVDFIHDPDPSRVTINQWVSDQTKAKIPELLPQGVITGDTRFVLANAIYFKAAWQTPFDATSTSDQAFTKGDGSSVQTPTMHQEGGLAYAAGDNYQAVELPYDGGQASMIVVLPAAGADAAIDAGMGKDFYASVTSALQVDDVSLSLPKFQIKGATISLKDELSSLGMAGSFTSAADFTGMVAGSQGDLFLGDVLHQAFVSVDESGTEAAAATAVIGVGRGAISDPKMVSVNRPFFFFIRDQATGSLLFMGRVTDPTQ